MSGTLGSSTALAAPRRNHFFYGKLLDEMHLRMEQEYLSGQRRLLNRLVLGNGVLCGLQVQLGPQGKGMVVSAGVAIDGLGREIVVPQDMQIDLRLLAEADGIDADEKSEVHLVLCYRECKADYQPALISDCAPEDAKAPSTIVESFAFELRAGLAADVPAPDGELCKALNNAQTADQRRRAIARVLDGAPCASPPAECCVVLANLGEGSIDTIGPRRRIYGNALIAELLHCLQCGGAVTQTPTLTTIKAISWNHDDGGKPLSMAQFMEGLRVTFNDKVQMRNAQGRHQGWFMVAAEYDEPKGGALVVQRVAEDKDGIGLEADGQTVRFKPHPAFEATFSERVKKLGGKDAWVRVTLHCDFLLDANGRPVDGNFFGERVADGVVTGDGVPGGTFESWFLLTLG